MFQIAWITPKRGFNSIDPMPHRLGGTRLPPDELPNSFFGYDPHIPKFPQRELGRQVGSTFPRIAWE